MNGFKLPTNKDSINLKPPLEVYWLNGIHWTQDMLQIPVDYALCDGKLYVTANGHK